MEQQIYLSRSQRVQERSLQVCTAVFRSSRTDMSDFLLLLLRLSLSFIAGYQQHDSQEFLSFVLDGVHEDLLRFAVSSAPQKMQLMDLLLVRAKELQTETLDVPETMDEFQLAQSEYMKAPSSFIDSRSSISLSKCAGKPI